MRLYVETRIRAELDELWERSQRPDLHQRWDLRFTTIEYLPADGEDRQRRFRYATRLAPGLVVAGTGIAAGERWRPDGTRTSALRFHSGHPLSLLAEGRGYWRYVPDGDAVRFLTGYDYAPRWGRFGRVADRFVFRPLMVWATAWSFDRLRLWCEHGVTPERALRNAVAELVLRLAGVAVVVGWAGVSLVGLLGVLAILLAPPLSRTPAARRCRTRPPAPSRGAAPPRILSDLGAP